MSCLLLTAVVSILPEFVRVCRTRYIMCPKLLYPHMGGEVRTAKNQESNCAHATTVAACDGIESIVARDQKWTSLSIAPVKSDSMTSL